MTEITTKPEGERLREWLRERNMTQSDLAEHMGKDRAQISKYITGERPVSNAFKHEFALAFGVPAHNVLFEPQLRMEGEHEPTCPD